MRRAPPIVALFALVLAPLTMQGQQAAPPQTWRVAEWQSLPAAAGAWRDGIAKLAKMTEAAKIMSPWFTYIQPRIEP